MRRGIINIDKLPNIVYDISPNCNHILLKFDPTLTNNEFKLVVEIPNGNNLNPINVIPFIYRVNVIITYVTPIMINSAFILTTSKFQLATI